MISNITRQQDNIAHIDLNDALDRLCNDYDLFKTILSLFCEEKLIEADSIMEMIVSKNICELKAWSHQSLGIARNLSLPAVVSILEKMVEHIEADHYQSLASEYKIVLAELIIIRELSKNM